MRNDVVETFVAAVRLTVDRALTAERAEEEGVALVAGTPFGLRTRNRRDIEAESVGEASVGAVYASCGAGSLEFGKVESLAPGAGSPTLLHIPLFRYVEVDLVTEGASLLVLVCCRTFPFEVMSCEMEALAI
ncbi:hypothetical protein [Streptomyces sp. NPDC005009]